MNDTLVLRNAKSVHGTRKVLHVGSSVRTFSNKKELPKTLFTVIKHRLQAFIDYSLKQVVIFGNSLRNNIGILEYLLDHIIFYQLVRVRNVFMYYVRLAGVQNTINAIYRVLHEPIHFIPLILYSFNGIIVLLFAIGFLEDPYSQQLNICNTEMTALVKGSLNDFDSFRFKESLEYLSNVSQDPQLQKVVRKMCCVYDHKINTKYNMEKLYPAWVDQHALAVTDSQAPYMFVAKIFFSIILCFVVVVLLNVNGEEFIPPIQDLPEAADIVSPVSAGSGDGNTTTESLSPIIEGWND